MQISVNDQADGVLSESGGRWQKFVSSAGWPTRGRRCGAPWPSPSTAMPWFPQRIEADGGWVAGGPAAVRQRPHAGGGLRR